MRNKKATKMLAAMLAAATVMSGCGGSQAETSSKGNESGEKKQETSNQDAEKSEEPVEIRVFYVYDPNTEPPGSKYLVEQMEKELNIKLVRDEVPASAYAEKLQLAMADGDYPDVFIFDDHMDPTLISAIDNGLIVPVNDYIKDMENIQKYTYPEALEAVKVKNDENMYLIPRTTVARADGFAVRKDWMDKLGIKVNSDNYSMTPEEFLDMAKKFTEEDPDGDGVDNTYGMKYNSSNGIMDVFYPGAFGCLGWEKSDGEYEYIDPQYEIGNERYRKALEFSREFYKYCHPDSALTTEVGVNEVGISSSFAGHISSRLSQVQEVEPEAELTYISGLSDEKGELHNGTSVPGIWGGLAITTACEYPEKVAEMVNWLLSDQAWEYALYGEPGVTYNKNDDGTVEVITEEYVKNKSVGTNWATSIARRKEDVDFFLDLSLPEKQLEEVRDWLNVAVDAVVMPLNNGKVPECAAETEFVEAQNKLKEVRTKIIMGTEDVSKYDEVLAQWYEQGGKEYVEEMNALIAKSSK